MFASPGYPPPGVSQGPAERQVRPSSPDDRIDSDPLSYQAIGQRRSRGGDARGGALRPRRAGTSRWLRTVGIDAFARGSRLLRAVTTLWIGSAQRRVVGGSGLAGKEDAPSPGGLGASSVAGGSTHLSDSSSAGVVSSASPSVVSASAASASSASAASADSSVADSSASVSSAAGSSVAAAVDVVTGLAS